MAHKERKAIETPDERDRPYLESLVRSDFERSHSEETLEDLKLRARFSKEDKGLLRDWMTLAARRAIAGRNEKPAFNLAA